MSKLRELFFTLYLICMFFYGLLIKVLYSTSYIGVLRFFPEFLLTIFLILIVNPKTFSKPKKDDILVFFTILLCFFFSLINIKTINSLLIAIRDILFPVLAGIIIKNSRLKLAEIKKLYKIFMIVCSAFLIFSLHFGYLQHTNGWEYTSTFYAGHAFYGNDTVASINIRTTGPYVRALGITGDSTKYGFYTLISFIVINTYMKKKSIFNISFVICLLNCIFSTSKTSIALMALLYLFMYRFLFNGLVKKVVIPVLIVSVIVFAYYVLTNLDDFYSIAERLTLWNGQNYFDITNIFIGVNLYSYFSGGWLSVIDNFFLFGMSSMGIIGFGIYFYYVIKNTVNTTQTNLTLLIVLIIGGLTVNLFSARSYIGLFFIMVSLEDLLLKKYNVKGIESL